MRSGWLAAVAGVWLAACTNGVERGGGAADVVDAGPLVASLEVKVDSAVAFHLHVTNVSDEPVQLEFRSAQRFDFVVRDPGGGEVWRWSADRAFAQMLGSETLAPHATVDYSALWQPGPGVEGDYVAEGVLTAVGRDVRQATRFALP